MYKEINYLPRWAYHDDEWKELVSSCDKIVGNKFYKVIEEPVCSDIDKFVNSTILAYNK